MDREQLIYVYQVYTSKPEIILRTAYIHQVLFNNYLFFYFYNFTEILGQNTDIKQITLINSLLSLTCVVIVVLSDTHSIPFS